MTQRLYLKAIAVCVILLALTHVVVAVAKQFPAFFKLFNNNIASKQVLEDIYHCRRDSAKPTILVLGDSVLYGSGMKANHVRHWRRHTMSAYLKAFLPEYNIIDVAMDGALPLDYLAMERLAESEDIKLVIFDLNYRMFAKKYQQNAQALSRNWLYDALPAGQFSFQPEITVNDRIVDNLRQYSILYRYAEAVRNNLFFPTREEKINQWLRQILPARSLREVGDEDMLRLLKMKPYYYTPAILEKDNTELQATESLMQRIIADNRKCIVFFTPQNMTFIEEIYNQRAFYANLALVEQTMNQYTQVGERRYFHWVEKYPEEAFYDHCHLIPAYNKKMAQEMARTIKEMMEGSYAQKTVE